METRRGWRTCVWVGNGEGATPRRRSKWLRQWQGTSVWYSWLQGPPRVRHGKGQVFLFILTFCYEIFQSYRKLERSAQWACIYPPPRWYPGSSINMLMGLFYSASIRPSVHLIFWCISMWVVGISTLHLKHLASYYLLEFTIALFLLRNADLKCTILGALVACM